MKSIIMISIFTVSYQALAFDFKELAEKVAKDKKTQEQIKEVAKKGIEYFQGNKKEASKAEVAKSEDAKVKEPKVKEARTTTEEVKKKAQ